MFDLLTTNVEEASCSKKRKKAFQTDAAKRDNLPNEIFDYIYAAKCKRLFSLAWYDDKTYASPLTPLAILCCDGPSCNLEDSEYLQ